MFGALGFLGNVQMVETSPGVAQYDTFGHQIGYTPPQYTTYYDTPTTTPVTSDTTTPVSDTPVSTPVTSTPVTNAAPITTVTPATITTVYNPVTGKAETVTATTNINPLESFFGLFAPLAANSANSTTPATTPVTTLEFISDIGTFYENNKTIVWGGVGLVGIYFLFRN